MIAFVPSDEQRLIQDTVADLARTVLRPRTREFEKARALPEDVRRTAHQMGLGTTLELGMVTAVLVEEALAIGDPAVPFALSGPGPLALALAEFGSDAQRARWLAPYAADDGYERFGAVAWSERRAPPGRDGLAVTAVREGETYRLDGTKSYVANALRADAMVVFAQVDQAKGWSGIGAFVLPRDSAGVSVMPRETSLGLDAASFADVELRGVLVPAADRLEAAADIVAATVRFFVRYGLLVAARAVGLSAAAVDIAREYCETRVAFGKPIAHFQAVAFTLADRAMDVEAARALLWRAAHAQDARVADREALRLGAQAVATALEAAMRCGDDAVQLHGGAGFMRDYPVEKLMRDAKQLQLCALSASHADQLAAALDLGVTPDPALVLPGAHSGATFT